MELINNQSKSLLVLVDNFGFIRTANSELGDEISFHCFIGECRFATTNLGFMIDHADRHKEKWSGFCYACNTKIFDEKVFLMKELSHMDGHKQLEDGISIDVQLSDGTLQAAVITAKARILCRYENSDIMLKPWIKCTLKNPNNCRKMLSKICLYALYKCMEKNCAFSTSCANNMLTHLEHHANCPTESGWLDCAYCDLVCDSCSSLVQHVRNEHSSSLYQCPYCFYRSCTAYNVVFHLKQFHDTREKSVLVCNGMEMSFTAKEAKTAIERHRSENVLPLRCSEVCCNNVTYLMDHFISHLMNSSELDQAFKCQRCGSNIPISKATEHLLFHNIGVYQCIYCIHGRNDIGSIQNHMVYTHPAQAPYICVRLTRKNHNRRSQVTATVESTMISELASTVDSNLLKKCPYTDEQLSTNLLVPATTPNSCSPKEICRLVNYPNNRSSHLQPASHDFLSYNDLKEEYTTDDWNKYFSTRLLSSLVDVSEHSEDSGIEPYLNDSDGENPDSVQQTGFEKRSNDQQMEIDEAVCNFVRRTGLEGRDLYRCSFPTCNEKLNDFDGFGCHLQTHQTDKLSELTGLKCYHCDGNRTPFVAQNIIDLQQHIQSHGIHRFFCYICDYTCSFEDKDHIRQAHNNQSHSATLPLNPMKRDANKDIFVMCPSGVAEHDLIRFGRYWIKKIEQLCTPSNDSNDHKSHAEQIPVLMLQSNSESIRFDDEKCNNTTPTQMIQTGQPIFVTNADTDDVNVKRESEPKPVIRIVDTNSILFTTDDDDDAQPSTSKPRPKFRARPRPRARTQSRTRTQTKLKEFTKEIINATDVVQKHTTTAPSKKMGEPKLPELVKYVCAYCPKSDMNLNDVYEHWKSKYKKPAAPNRTLPFRFRIVKVFKCYHCRQYNTYADLKRHCEQKHSGKHFAMIDNTNPSKCGLCEKRVGMDIIDHFKEHHNRNAGTKDTIRLEDYLTDELLNKVNSLSVSEDRTTDDQIIYGCPNCNATGSENSNQLDTVAHIRKHFLQYQCKFESCNEIFQSLPLIKEHHKISHGDDETYRNVDINDNLDKHLDMKIIFPNGLLVTKRECQHTEFGVMDEVKKAIEKMNAGDLRQLRKRPAEKRKYEPSLPKPKNNKKKRAN